LQHRRDEAEDTTVSDPQRSQFARTEEPQRAYNHDRQVRFGARIIHVAVCLGPRMAQRVLARRKARRPVARGNQQPGDNERLRFRSHSVLYPV
jgi:hypothetical protein